MTSASRDRERAAAIGNTSALQEVLLTETKAVAADRVSARDEAWTTTHDATGYSRVLGAFIMQLIENERTNAVQRAYAVHDANSAALTRAVQQVRS